MAAMEDPKTAEWSAPAREPEAPARRRRGWLRSRDLLWSTSSDGSGELEGLEGDSDVTVTTASSVGELGDERLEEEEGEEEEGSVGSELECLAREKADRMEVFEARTYDRMIVGTALAAVLKRLDALEEAVEGAGKPARGPEDEEEEEAAAARMIRRQDEDIAGLVAVRGARTSIHANVDSFRPSLF